MAALFNKTWLIIALIIFVSLAIHVPFALFDCFGEQDAARIAADVTYQYITGRTQTTSPRVYSCPLYLFSLYLSLRSHMIHPRHLAALMTALSLVASALFSAWLFWFLFQAIKSRRVALTAVALLQLSPAYWFGSLYGFPTMVSVCLLIMSAAVFQLSFRAQQPIHGRILAILSAWLLFFGAVSCKVDAMMAAALFALPLWQHVRNIRVKMACFVGLALIVFVTFLLFNFFAVSLAGHRAPSSAWTEWKDSFYVGLGSLFSKQNAKIVGQAIGIASMGAAIGGSVLTFMSKQLRPAVLFIFLTFVPILLFWGMIGGNSGRHNLIPAAFVPVLLALPLATDNKSVRRIWPLVLLFLCIVNYCWFSATSRIDRPSGALAQSAILWRANRQAHAQLARQTTHLSQSKVAILGASFLMPYYYFEILASDHLRFAKKKGGALIMKDNKNAEKEFYFPDLPQQKRSTLKKTLNKLRKEGYYLIFVKP